MKLCIKCKSEPQRGSGSYCKACHNEYQKAYYKRTYRHRESVLASMQRRKEVLRDLVRAAKDVPCTDCGTRYPYYVMDMDHVRGEKKIDLSRIASSLRNIEVVRAEIVKCDPVCSNCHRERTWSRMRTLRCACSQMVKADGCDPSIVGSIPTRHP